MKWLWVAITVTSGTIGDLLSAHGMSQHGVHEFSPSMMRRTLRFIFSHRSVVLGIIANATSFISFMALLSISPLNFAVPATALGYILRTVLAKIFLHEQIGAKRWAGAFLVAIGVILIAL
ncbi:MAG TPA: EamA family transporter [Bryobacteraceae bacterium]|nr:EamA family transporter [Bryobacteraceae bacterium]